MILYLSRVLSVLASLRQAQRQPTRFPKRPAFYPRRALCPLDTRGFRQDVAIPEHLRH